MKSAPAKPAQSPNATASPVVLVADDDRLVLATLSQGLRNAGFSIIEADSGAAALQLCAARPPDIAVIDYQMPDINGLEVAKALQIGATVPVIFLSAYGDNSIVDAAVEAGAMAYLLKPMDPAKLAPTIRATLRRYSEFKTMRGESEQLLSALKGARTTSIVVGLLMARMHLSEKQAYDHLRHYCRSRNRKVTEVAADILGATERLNLTLNDIHASHQTPGRPTPSP